MKTMRSLLLASVMIGLCSMMIEGEDESTGGAGAQNPPESDKNEEESSVEDQSQNPHNIGNPTAPEPGAEGSGLAATESLDGHNDARTTGGHPGLNQPAPPTDEEGDAISQAAADAREANESDESESTEVEADEDE